MANVTLMKRGSSWQYRFDVINPEGKRTQISKAGFKTKTEAREAGLEAMLAHKSSGVKPTSGKIFVANYLDSWFADYCTTNPRYNTQIHHSRVLLRHIKPHLGNYLLEDLSPAVVQQFMLDLLKEGLSARYVREILAILSLALESATNIYKNIPENPCKKVSIPKRLLNNTSRDRFFITPEDFKKILRKFDKHSPARIALLLGYFAGLRIGEVFALTWDDIDFNRRTLTVNKNAIQKAKDSKALDYISTQRPVTQTYGWYLGPTKTACSRRTIQISKYLLEALKIHREIQEQNKEFFGDFYTIVYKKVEEEANGDRLERLVEVEKGIPVILKEANLICLDNYGKYFSYERFKKFNKVIREELNIPFNFHSLRHTHASLLIQEGASIKDVQERLGHSNAMITLKLYTHNTPKSKKKTLDILDNHSLEITDI